MWLEVKATITVIAIFIISLALSITGNIIVSIITIMGIVTMLFGDMLIGWKIVSTDAINVLDPNGPNERIVDLHLIGGGRRILKGKKGARGKIEFVFHKKEASVIDNGDYPIHFPNGNQGVIAHEKYDKNVNLYEVQFLNEASKDLEANDVKEMRDAVISRRKTYE